MKALSSSLVKAQKAFAPALKVNTNPHFKSRYVDLAGCVEAVIDALNENGIFLMQPTRLCDEGVTVETVFLHESGEMLSGGVYHVPATKQDPQGYGSALTYARRQSLMAACGIAPEDDDGNAASRGPTRPAAPATSTKADPKVAACAKKVADAKSVEALNDLFASIDDEKLRKQMASTFKARKAEILGVAQ